jgi:hypothetical protein
VLSGIQLNLQNFVVLTLMKGTKMTAVRAFRDFAMDLTGNFFTFEA